MTTQICTTPTDRFVYRRVAGPLRISAPAEFFFQHLKGISPRRLTDGHRSTSKSGQIATHPPTDRWQDSSSTVVRAARREKCLPHRSLLQPRRATPTSRGLNFAAVHVDSNHDEPRESRRPAPDDVRRNVSQSCPDSRAPPHHSGPPKTSPSFSVAFLTSCPKIAVNVTILFTRK